MASKYLCENTVPPGTVVLLLNDCDVKESVWGVALPYEYWAKESRKDAVSAFADYSRNGNIQIPVLEFGSDYNWGFCFQQFPMSVKSLFPLEDFTLKGDAQGITALWACSLRDGSRYYAKLLNNLSYLARASSESFVQGGRQSYDAIGVLNVQSPGRAIYDWQQSQK